MGIIISIMIGCLVETFMWCPRVPSPMMFTGGLGPYFLIPNSLNVLIDPAQVVTFGGR